MRNRDPKLEKAAEVCINIVRKKFPNCSVKRNDTNDNSVSITFNNFESEDNNSEYGLDLLEEENKEITTED